MTDTQSQLPIRRAQWVLAAQPGRHVTAVTDAEGYLWPRRFSDDGEEFDTWIPAGRPDAAAECDEEGLAWSPLLVEFGPLDDATPGGASS